MKRSLRPHRSPVAKLKRRTVTIPLYVACALVAAIGAPLWLLLTLSADTLKGPRWRFGRTRAALFLTLYFGCELLGIVTATLIGVLTIGGRLGGHKRFIGMNASLQRWWTSTLFRGLVWLFSMQVEVEGVETARQGPFLLFVRHTSAADTLLAAHFVANPHCLLLKYVIKRSLLWDPCLDIVGCRLPNAFIDRTSSDPDAEVRAIISLTDHLDAESAVLIYPEGTRFTPSKLKKALQKLEERGFDELAVMARTLRHVLPPRVKGPLALLSACPDNDVVMLEHSGLEVVTNFTDVFNGALVGQKLRVRVRRFSAQNVDRVQAARWLYERWQEMDDWIAREAPPKPHPSGKVAAS